MINILIVVDHQRITAIHYYRQLLPHAEVNKDENYTVEKVLNVEGMSDDELKKYHIVQFSRLIPDPDITVKRLHKLGLVVFLDLDDYWIMPQSHILHKEYKNGITKTTIESITLADYVTTTTPFLAEKCEQFNTNTHILSNAIDPDQWQFRLTRQASSLIRIGWIGGIHHGDDIEILRAPMKRVWHDKTIYNKIQILLGGFNITKININEKTGKTFLTNDNPVYKEFEKILSGGYYAFVHMPKYRKYLAMYKQISTHTMLNKPYRRMWAKSADQYAIMYNELDISLAPLANTALNRCKSQLKLIEAGFMRTALLCSPIEPYAIDGLHDDNCIFVNHDWYTQIKSLVNNPTKVVDLAESLYETVKDKYHIKTVTKMRKQIYENV